MIHGENLWRNPTVYLGTQPANSVAILPDMQGIVATFDKVIQPVGWTKNQPSEPVTVWVWTSDGNANAGTVTVYAKPASGSASSTTAAERKFSIEPDAPYIASHATEGTVGLRAGFEKAGDPPAQVIDEFFFAVEGAVVDSGATVAEPTGCLDKSSVPWKIGEPCRIELGLKNLLVGKVVTITAYSLKADGKTKVPHPPIALEIR